MAVNISAVFFNYASINIFPQRVPQDILLGDLDSIKFPTPGN